MPRSMRGVVLDIRTCRNILDKVFLHEQTYKQAAGCACAGMDRQRLLACARRVRRYGGPLKVPPETRPFPHSQAR